VGSCDDYGLIGNGSFEGVEAPWSHTGGAAVYTNEGNFPNTGTGYMYIGGTFSTSGSFRQTLAIPGLGALGGAVVRAQRDKQRELEQPAGRDAGRDHDSSDRVLQLLATYSSLDRGAAGAYVKKTGFDCRPTRASPCGCASGPPRACCAPRPSVSTESSIK
jgi:hypothetical protein